MNDTLKIGGKSFKNRLILGTGKFSDDQTLYKCIEKCKTEMVTVALRRVDINSNHTDILNVIPDNIQIIPNTSGAKNAKQAIKIAEICKASGMSDWIKVEITPDSKYLLPDPIETIKACEDLVSKGFTVLPYINADPLLCKNLENIGCAAVMPLGAPIGSGKGLTTLENLKIIIERSTIPVIIDAGIGKPSHATQAMEIGADAIMLNTAISLAENPVNMTAAFDKAIKAGRLAYLSGLMNESYGSASSPLEGILEDL